jgi:hypothetical protein
MIGGIGLLLYQLLDLGGREPEFDGQRRAVFPIKRAARSAKLGIEYHFDRNAMLDSRLVGTQIVGLAAAGNLVAFDAESFVLRSEKVLFRRATCLGSGDETHVMAGISNGCIVRVNVADLTLERVTDVPGTPRWIGKRVRSGALVIAYQVDLGFSGSMQVTDEGRGRTYDVGVWPILFLDSKDRLWSANGDKVHVLDLETSTRKELEWKGGWAGVRGFAELSDGQVWVLGGAKPPAEPSSFIVRLAPDAKPVLLHSSTGKRRLPSAPASPIQHVLEDVEASQVLVVSRDSAFVTDRDISDWKPLEAMAGGHRDEGALLSLGQAHRTKRGILLTLARGGFMEVTPDFTRRHVLEGQDSVARPSEIVRLAKGMAFYGDGGPLFYADGGWHALPEPIMPPAELMGPARPGENERGWVATLTIPIGGEASYVLMKAGPPRLYLGHIHGLRDVFMTSRWNGKELAILGREDLPIEPADTFVSPDHQLWNVDDQGLWSFSGGRWHLVTRAAPGSGGHGSTTEAVAGRSRPRFKSGIGEPLHFAETASPPFFGLPSAGSSWSMVRLDPNEAGGVPLIDEVAVKLDDRRLLLHDVMGWENKKDELLLATDHGLCIFNIKWGTCSLLHPDGLSGEVSLFMRDGAKRLWLGGRGLWALRDLKHATAMNPSIPMLADSRVVAMAEAPDGRLVLGLEDRGAIFLTVPQGWFHQPPELPSMPAPWESTRPHERGFLDQAIVLRECQGKGGQASDSVQSALASDLRDFAQSLGSRVHVGAEEVFEGRPDIVVRGAEPEKLVAGILPLLAKQGGKARYAVWKRQGPRGSEAALIQDCPRQLSPGTRERAP